MKTTIISLHGVRASQGSNGWQNKLGEYIEKCGRTDINYVPYFYGWIPAFYSTIPFISKYYVNKFRKYLYKNIYPKYGNNICVVCHSFGTYVAFHALKDSFGCKALILFGGILHCREDFDGIVSEKIESCENFHSLEDEVAKYAPQGHCGFHGFRHKNTKSKKWRRHPYPNKKITNHRLFLPEHTEYFDNNRFSDILKLLS